MTDKKDLTFWGWLTQEFTKHGYQPYEIVKIIRPVTFEVYDYDRFINFTNRRFSGENREAIYRGNLIFFMVDDSQFHYSWCEEYDEGVLWERRLRYIPSLKAIQDKLVEGASQFTEVHIVYKNDGIPDELL